MAVIVETMPGAEAVRSEVERILQSRIFRASDVLRHLFTYLTGQSLSGNAENLKEYTIGLEALGKPSSFDPRQESVVRMHTARLRQKLAEYYRTEGVEDPILVDLPKGGFKLTFEYRQAPVEPLPRPQAAMPAIPATFAASWRVREIVLLIALVAAIGFGAYAGERLLRTGTSGPEAVSGWTPALRQLWDPLISSNRRLVVCIATPMFVRVPGFGFVRESSVNDWDEANNSKQISSLEGALRTSIAEPSYNYTEAGTATGAFLLGQFLAPRKQNVRITRANVLSWPEIAEDNIVFVGPSTGIHQAEDIPMDVQFVLDSAGIRNLKPRPGEPDFIRDQPGRNGEESGVTHALISRIPGMNGPGAILMLSGNQTASVMGSVQAFTNPTVAQMLVSKLKSRTGTIPRYFQVVLSVKSMDDVPVDVSYMFHRELPESVGNHR
jgi:hypothetical protein